MSLTFSVNFVAEINKVGGVFVECEVEEPIQEPTAPAQQQESAFYDAPQQQSAPLRYVTGLFVRLL